VDLVRTMTFLRGTFSGAWSSGRERAVYSTMILAPLVALALVAALGGESSRRVSELPNGGVLLWTFPRSAIREVVVYAGVALWLLRELRRRTPDEFRQTLWRAPVIVGMANLLLGTPFVLVHGSLTQVLAEQSGLIGVRFLVRIVVVCGYVALGEWILGQLRREGSSGPKD
jgi:MFS family permease